MEEIQFDGKGDAIVKGVINAGDETLGREIGRSKKPGLVLFCARSSPHFVYSLMILEKLQEEFHGNITFIKVEMEDERGLVLHPDIKVHAKVGSYPVWAGFKDGIMNLQLVMLRKGITEQVEDLKSLLRGMGVE